MASYYIYIMTNKPNGVLYIGVTNNLPRRVYKHKNNLVHGFTSKYKLYKLVYFAETQDIYRAISHEKRIKKWKRQWKLDLINEFNPGLLDLYNTITSYPQE